MLDKLKDRIKNINKKFLAINIAVVAIGILAIGYIVRLVISNLGAMVSGEPFLWHPMYLLQPATWLTGGMIVLVLWAVFWLGGGHMRGLFNGSFFGGKAEKAMVDGVLENSRFMTDKERDKFFYQFDYDNAGEAKRDGVPMRAILDKKGKLQCNFMPNAHSLIIGATGSGKTTTFINPMIQLLGATNCGSSMIMTDPKGELFAMHSKYLKERGYDVLLLDLRDTYSSSRWNPLGGIWDMYQEYVHAGKGIVAHRDSMADYPELKQMDGMAEEGQENILNLLRCHLIPALPRCHPIPPLPHCCLVPALPHCCLFPLLHCLRRILYLPRCRHRQSAGPQGSE